MQHVKMLFVYANLVFLLFADATGYLLAKSGVDINFNLTFPEAAKKLNEFSVVYKKTMSENHILFDVINESTDMKYFDNPYKTRVQKISLTSNGVVFKLRDVTLDDAGNYTCLCTNQSFMKECEELLIVLGKPSKPELHGNATVVSRSNLMLSCSSNSTSRPPNHLKMQYIWKRNDVVVQRNYSSNFSVGQISREDNDVNYSCQAQEQEGLTSDWSPDAVLDVLYGPSQAVLYPDSSIYNVTENRLLEIACSGDCNPACNVIWFDQNGRTVSPGTGNRTVFRKRPARNMTGMYGCELSNNFGKASTNFSINVMFGPIVHNFTVNNNKKVTVKENDVGPIKQVYAPVAIIVAAICSLFFVIAAICAAVYINRYKNRKGHVYSIPEEDGNDVGYERSLYARVNKPKIKPCKAKKRKGGDVYTTVKKAHTQPKPCTNHLYMASGRPSEGQALIHRDADDRMSGNVNNNCGEKNAEGLTYADLDLAPPTMVNGQPVINSKEEPVVYEEIDFSQTPGPQLPEKIWEKEGSAP